MVSAGVSSIDDRYDALLVPRRAHEMPGPTAAHHEELLELSDLGFLERDSLKVPRIVGSQGVVRIAHTVLPIGCDLQVAH